MTSLWIKRLVLGLVGLVLLAGIALAVLVSTFDPNRYKGIAVDWMKQNRNRTLVIDGPISLSVFPRVAVNLSKVTLSEAGKPDEFAGLDEAALAVATLPLLRGALVVDRIEVRGARAVLLRDAQGKRNIDDLIGAGDTATAPAAPAGGTGGAGSSQPLRFDVSRIALKNVRLRVADRQAGLDGELQLDEFSSGRIADGVEAPVAAALQADFKQPALKTKATLDARITPDTATGSVRLAALKLQLNGDVPGAKAIDATLKGASIAWDGTRKALQAQQLALEVSGGVAGLALKDSTVDIDRFGFDPAAKLLSIDRLKLRLKGTQDGQALTGEIDWPGLDVRGESLKGGPLTGQASLGGNMPLVTTFKTGAPSGGFDLLRIPSLELKLTSNGAQRKIGATLRTNLALQPAKASATLDALDLQATLDEPGLKPVAVSVRGRAAGSAKAADWTLNGQLNGSPFESEGKVDLAAKPMRLTTKARFDTLDLNTLLPAPAAGAASGAKAGPAPADTPVDLAPLRSVNATVDARIGKLSVRQYRVADAKFAANLDNGLLRVTTLQGGVWGGTVDATAQADAKTNRVAVKAVASGVNIEALLKDVANKDLLEGSGRVTLDVASTGRSVGELRSKLGGSAAVQLRDGAIKGINLAKTLRQAKAALALKQDAAQKATQTEKTDFSELNASFQIADGVARSTDLDLKSPFLRLGGDGAIDVGKGRIDYTARATVTPTAAGQGGAELAALKGVTVPVRLTGPFEAIEWKVQWSAVAAGALRNQVEDKLKERLGIKPAEPGASAPKPKDALKEKLLKGLFK